MKKIKSIQGNIYATCSFNNTLISLYDTEKKLITWSSGGAVGFKGSRKSTNFAAQLVAEKIGAKSKSLGFKKVDLYIKGMGRGRRTIPKFLRKQGVRIRTIYERTPLAHNGCRPSKRRRT
jgi:small subunit ribosomal protein S11